MDEAAEARVASLCTLQPPHGLALPAPPVHLLAFLDLLVRTSLRDLYSRRAALDDTALPAQEHVQRNPFLWDRICARWVLPTWAGEHAHRFFVSAPLFMEDRQSHHVIGRLTARMLPTLGAVRTHLPALCWLLMLRRILRSNPCTWQLLEPKLLADLGEHGLLGFRISRVRRHLEDIATEMGVSLASLFGPGRHWFAPGMEQKTDWLGHSLALLQSYRPVARKLAALLLKPAATVGMIGDIVRDMPGSGEYVSKFVQGDLATLTGATPFLRTLHLDDEISVGPGAGKYLELIFQSADRPGPPSIAQRDALVALKFLFGQVMLAVHQQHPHVYTRDLGSKLGALWTIRCALPGGPWRKAPTLHDIQVACCVAHVAYHTWSQYVASIPVQIVHALPSPADAAVERWTDCLRAHHTPQAQASRQAARSRKWAKDRAATTRRKTRTCQFCGATAESFSAQEPGKQMRWRCLGCGREFQTRCARTPSSKQVPPPAQALQNRAPEGYFSQARSTRDRVKIAAAHRKKPLGVTPESVQFLSSQCGVDQMKAADVVSDAIMQGPWPDVDMQAGLAPDRNTPPVQNGKKLLPGANISQPDTLYEDDDFTDEEGEEALEQDEANSADQKAKEEAELKQCLQSVETDEMLAQDLLKMQEDPKSVPALCEEEAPDSGDEEP
ncbi:unnamed protein product, partial [Symbiodinium microadriaticum]